MKRLIEIDPLDTLFFRDGRPFDQIDAGLADAASVFPPMPSTLSGMLAAAIARQLAGGAFDPTAVKYKDWSTADFSAIGDENRNGEFKRGIERLCDLTGRGAAPLGGGQSAAPLRAEGPYLLKFDESTGKRELFVPWPSTLGIEEPGGTVRNLLPQQSQAIETDSKNDKLRWPVPSGMTPGRILKDVQNGWMRHADYVHYLDDMEGFANPGRDYDRMLGHIALDRGRLFCRDERIGIALDPVRRGAIDGRLYAAAHVRLHRGIRLAAFLDSDKDFAAELLPRHAAFGGVGRQVALTVMEAEDTHRSYGKFRIDRGEILVRIVALTPIPIGTGGADQPAGAMPGLPAFSGDPTAAAAFARIRIASAVAARPQVAGRWQSGTAEGIRVFPAGSTWFAAVPTEKKKADNAAPTLVEAGSQLRLAPPDLAGQGFGVFAIGNWP